MPKLKLLYQADASSDKTTAWAKTQNKHRGRKFDLQGAQIIWDGLGGVLNGTLVIQGSSNIKKAVTVLSTTNVTSASNLTNATKVALDSGLESIRCVYTANGITSGTIEVVLNYLEI